MTRCVSSTGPGGSDHVGTRLLSPCQCKPLWRAEAPATKRPSQRAAGCTIPSMAWTLLSGCHAIVHESRPLKIPQFQTLTRNLSTDTWEAGGMSQRLHDICKGAKNDFKVPCFFVKPASKFSLGCNDA